MEPHLDLRAALNAVSDVVANRPRPLRRFDQIFMKSADMLVQAEHVGRSLVDRDVVFVGDGDAIALCIAHLYELELIEHAPKSITVLDFDERVVSSVRAFASRYNMEERIQSVLYNVADPLPDDYKNIFHGFYTNPPFGASNDGTSVRWFLRRGMEASARDAIGHVVIADEPGEEWTQRVLRNTQRYIVESGWVVSELIPNFHRYHLDDHPELRSCSMTVRTVNPASGLSSTNRMPESDKSHFYGCNNPLTVRYVRSHGDLDSADHLFEEY